MWYAVYEEATGALRSSGSVLAPVLPEGWASKTFPAPPDPGKVWNPATLAFDLDVPPEPEVWTPVAIMQRFTAAERIAIRAAQKSDPVIEDFFELVRVAGDMRSDHPMIAQGLAYLQGQGLLSAARAAEIGGV